MRVLFLDIDGVVCCNFRGELEADKLSQVSRICSETDAKVVLSSDWRRQPHLKARATQTLASYGVEVIGATPQYAMMGRVRPREIMAWYNDCNVPIEGWCAVDDRDLVLEEGGQEFTNHFVLTEFHVGLNAWIANQIITRLRAPSTRRPRRFAGPAASPESPSTLPPPPVTYGTRPAAGAAPAAGLPQTGLVNLLQLLDELSIHHLAARLRGETLHSLLGKLDSGGGRVTLLAYLREKGVPTVSERQLLVNGLSRARRQGRLSESARDDGAARNGAPAPDDAASMAAAPLATGSPPELFGSLSLRAGSAPPAVAPTTPPRAPAPAPAPAPSPVPTSPPRQTQQHAAKQPSVATGALPAREEVVQLTPGAMDSLEGLLTLPAGASTVAVVTHPSPLRGGDMHNPFVVATCEQLGRRGVGTLRFNFRAVHSDSSPYSDDDETGASEQLQQSQADLVAAISLLASKAPRAKRLLIGYSYGAYVNLCVARAGARGGAPSVHALALVAPPLAMISPARHPGLPMPGMGSMMPGMGGPPPPRMGA